MSGGRNLYPFSPCKSAKESLKTDENAPCRAAFSFKFIPNTYSIEIDDQDQVFKSGLRRKSFTGETPHPLLRQLSSVSIPTEHNEEDCELDDSNIDSPSRPEHVDSRKKDLPSQCNKDETLVSTPRVAQGSAGKNERPNHSYNSDLARLKFNSSTSPPEEQHFLEKKPPSYTSLASEGKFLSSQLLERDFQNLEVTTTDLRDTKGSEVTKDQALEIKKQDEYMEGNYSLHRFYIIPDGNCLYRAVAQAVLLDQNQHMILRQLALDHIREHKEEFKNIIEGDLAQFLVAARREGEWAGYPEILALSRLLDININITTGGTPSNPNVQLRLHYFENPDRNQKTGSSPAKKTAEYTQRESIWLSWLGSGHYDTFIDKMLDNPAYEDWCHSRESAIKSDAEMANQIYMDDANRRYAEENNQRSEGNCNAPAAEDDFETLSAGKPGLAIDSCIADENSRDETLWSHLADDESEAPPPYSDVDLALRFQSREVVENVRPKQSQQRYHGYDYV